MTAETRLWEAAAAWVQEHIRNARSYSTTVCRSRAMQAYMAGYAAAKKEKRRGK